MCKGYKMYRSCGCPLPENGIVIVDPCKHYPCAIVVHNQPDLIVGDCEFCKRRKQALNQQAQAKK